jgi:hypothetical protein
MFTLGNHAILDTAMHLQADNAAAAAVAASTDGTVQQYALLTAR